MEIVNMTSSPYKNFLHLIMIIFNDFIAVYYNDMSEGIITQCRSLTVWGMGKLGWHRPDISDIGGDNETLEI